MNENAVTPILEECQVFTTQPLSLAMAYIPYQQWNTTYEPALGLQRGTIFPELDKPFVGEEAITDD